MFSRDGPFKCGNRKVKRLYLCTFLLIAQYLGQPTPVGILFIYETNPDSYENTEFGFMNAQCC